MGTAKSLRDRGYDLHHEQFGGQGIVSWQFAANAPDTPWGSSSDEVDFGLVVHLVRHPLDVIGSLANSVLGTKDEERFLEYARRFVLVPPYTAITQATWFWVGWNKLTSALNPDIVHRVEDGVDDLVERISSYDCFPKITPKRGDVPKNFNHRVDYRRPTLRQIRAETDDWLVDELVVVATRLGYDI